MRLRLEHYWALRGGTISRLPVGCSPAAAFFDSQRLLWLLAGDYLRRDDTRSVQRFKLPC